MVTLTLNVSGAVAVTGGTPTLSDSTAIYTGGSGGTTSLSFSYTVAAGQNTPDLTVISVNPDGATITDSAGNNATYSGTLTPTGMLQICSETAKLDCFWLGVFRGDCPAGRSGER